MILYERFGQGDTLGSFFLSVASMLTCTLTCGK